MNSRWLCGTIAAILSFCVCAANAQRQSAPESLPSGPTPAPLILPKTGVQVPLYSSKPQDVSPPPPLPNDQESFCTTPSDTTYPIDKPVTPAGRKATEYYLRTVNEQIWKNWKIPREANDPWLKGAVVRVKFEILPDGSLNDAMIMMSSGRLSYDRRALESIKHAAPFAPPPADGISPVKVCFSFRYNMDKQDGLPVDVFAKKPTPQ